MLATGVTPTDKTLPINLTDHLLKTQSTVHPQSLQMKKLQAAHQAQEKQTIEAGNQLQKCGTIIDTYA